MSSITVSIPESLFAQIRELTSQEQTSVEQFALAAITEKVSHLVAVDYITERAKRANVSRFDALLAKVPDVEPEVHDRI